MNSKSYTETRNNKNVDHALNSNLTTHLHGTPWIFFEWIRGLNLDWCECSWTQLAEDWLDCLRELQIEDWVGYAWIYLKRLIVDQTKLEKSLAYNVPTDVGNNVHI